MLVCCRESQTDEAGSQVNVSSSVAEPAGIYKLPELPEEADLEERGAPRTEEASSSPQPNEVPPWLPKDEYTQVIKLVINDRQNAEGLRGSIQQTTLEDGRPVLMVPEDQPLPLGLKKGDVICEVNGLKTFTDMTDKLGTSDDGLHVYIARKGAQIMFREAGASDKEVTGSVEYKYESREAILNDHKWLPEGCEPFEVIIKRSWNEALGFKDYKKLVVRDDGTVSEDGKGNPVIGFTLEQGGLVKQIDKDSLIFSVNGKYTHEEMIDTLLGKYEAPHLSVYAMKLKSTAHTGLGAGAVAVGAGAAVGAGVLTGAALANSANRDSQGDGAVVLTGAAPANGANRDSQGDGAVVSKDDIKLKERPGSQSQDPSMPSGWMSKDRAAILAEHPWIPPGFEPSLVTVTKNGKDEAVGLSVFEKKQCNGRDVIAVQVPWGSYTEGKIMPGSLIFKVNQAETFDDMIAQLKSQASLKIYLMRRKFFTTRHEEIRDMEDPLGLLLFLPKSTNDEVIVWSVNGDDCKSDGTAFWNHNTTCRAGEEVVRFDKLVRMQTGDVDTKIKEGKDVLEHFKLLKAARAKGVKSETVVHWERPQKAIFMSSHTVRCLNTWEA